MRLLKPTSIRRSTTVAGSTAGGGGREGGGIVGRISQRVRSASKTGDLGEDVASTRDGSVHVTALRKVSSNGGKPMRRSAVSGAPVSGCRVSTVDSSTYGRKLAYESMSEMSLYSAPAPYGSVRDALIAWHARLLGSGSVKKVREFRAGWRCPCW